MSSGGKIRKPDYNNYYESFSSWWDISRAIVEDYSNDGFDYQRVQNENGNDKPTDGQLVTYRMKTNGNRYLVPSESYFEFRFNLTQSNGADLPVDDGADGPYFYVYDGGNCFYISRASYFIGEREVERRDYCDIAEIVDRLLNSPKTKQNKADWRPDTGKRVDILAEESFNHDKIQFNKGAFKKLLKDVDNNRTPSEPYNLRIALTDLFNLHNYYPIAWRGQEHQIRLQLKNPSEGSVVHTNSPTTAHVNIQRLILWSATVRPSANRQSELLAMTGDDSKQLMQWEAMNVFQKNFGSPGTTAINWRITDASTRVQRVVIMCQNSDQSSDQTINSHVVPFTRRVTNAYINYNGVKVPQIDLTSDNGVQYNRFYKEYLRCAGYGRNSTDSAYLTYEEFVDAYALICFDLSQLDKQVDSFGALSTLDLTASFEGAGDIILTACVFQDRAAYLQNGRDAMMIESVQGLN